MEERKKYKAGDLRDGGLMPGEDDVLREMADQFFRAEKDIAEVKSDPMYEETRKSVIMILADYRRDKLNPETEKFITVNMTGINNETDDIRREAKKNRIDELSSEWVEEWHKNKQKNGSHAREIREFVAESFNEAEKQSAATSEKLKANQGRSLILRYVMAAAAVIAGAVIVITSLVRTGDPDKLFDKYYSPVHAISQVTRNSNAEVSATWEDAVNSYNEGDYSSASEAFARLSAADPLLIPPRFYLGLSYLAAGNYKGAEDLLEGVAETSLEYSLEAVWYLGLVRLKTGDIKGAALCFDLLSPGPGYYSERSAKILLRLK